MSTERIDIQITENGSRRVKKGLDDIGHAADGAERLVSLLHHALGALGLEKLIHSLVETVDSFTLLQNRIRQFTQGQEQLAVVTDELLKIANHTRIEFETTATLYSRVGRAAAAMGISQQQALEFTDALSEAVTLSGVTASEASRGVLELTHAFSAGRLSTRELRVVMKDVPEVARAMADGLGITTAALLHMGEEGKITGKQVVEAFLKVHKTLDEKMGKSIITIDQSLTILSNNWEVWLGKLNATTGISQGIAKIILGIANNMDTLGKIAEVLAITLGVTLALKAIPALVDALKKLYVLMADNPLTALIIIITAVTAALVLFSDQIGVSEDGFITLHDLGVAVFGHLRILVHTLAEGFSKAWDYILQTGEALFGDLVDTSLSFPRAILKGLDYVIVRFLSFSAGVVAIWRQAMDNLKGYTGITLKDAFSDAFDKSMQALTQNGQGPLERGLDKLMEEAKQVASERVELDRLQKLKEDKARADLNKHGAPEAPVPEKFKKSFGSELQELKNEGLLLLKTANAREAQNNVIKIESALKRGLTEDEKNQVVAVTKTNIALKLRSDALTALGGPTEQYTSQVNALNAIMRDTPQLTDAVTEELAKLEQQFLQNQTGGSMLDGYVRQLRLMQLETRNAVADMGATFATLFGPGGQLVQGIGDAVAQSVIFGERFDQAIKHVAQSVVANLISSLVQLGINMALNAALGNSLSAAAAATSIATAGVVSAAWGPAATLVNAATFGAGAAAGTTALTTSLAAIKGLSTVSGFAAGGYTGNGGRGTVAGVVHGQEYVLNASATRRLGRGNLDRLNGGSGLGTSVNVSIVNRDIPGAEFQVRQLNETDVEIIAQRAVQQHAPTVIAQDLSNSQSRTSRAVSTHTTATRRRNG